jgi:hypothetical protein
MGPLKVDAYGLLCAGSCEYRHMQNGGTLLDLQTCTSEYCTLKLSAVMCIATSGCRVNCVV